MAKKRYISAKGQEINFDLLARQNETVVAVGNANLNARGDRLGHGGRIVETAEEILMKAAERQAADPTTGYDQTNPKAVKMISIKDNVNLATSYQNTPTKINADELKTPAEALKAARETVAAKQESAKKKESKRKIVDKED